ncbi:PEGA domain-containing protein [Pendulispora albinea]|uniref:PEGA domain-containing protein n=1 Tax=Pendulispora albinea TaxID=2741071 RepID=A0ABZ2MCP4_9BACT
MKKHSRRISLLLALAIASAPVAAYAQEPSGRSAQTSKMEEARTRYTRGMKLYDEGNAQAARAEFERAYALAPSYRILYNIGLCYQATNDYVEALRAFERYLSEGGQEITDDRRAEVNKQINDLKPNIASVTITTNVAGASITIDDVAVGQSPLSDKILVNPGRRKVSATKQGLFPATKSIVFVGSENAQVNLELTEPPQGQAAPEKTTDLTPYILWGATGALAIGAGVTGFLALKAHSNEEDVRDRYLVTKPEIEDAHSKTKTLSITADVLTAATLITGGVALYFTVFKSKPAPSSTEASASARLTPGGVSIVGRF